MERPNTVAGLMAKRKELYSVLKGLQADINKTLKSIDHLDATIALFDPQLVPRAAHRYGTKDRARRGRLTSFVMDQLRQSPVPMSSHELTRAWIELCGIDADGKDFENIRKRTRVCLTSLKRRGITKGDSQSGWTVGD